jgi:hypothetical protein
MTRLAQTSESWIGAIFFVMNILKLSREYFWLFLNGLILSIFLRNPNYESDYLVKLNPVI